LKCHPSASAARAPLPFRYATGMLQFDVCYLSEGWRHLVNAYEGKAGMV